MRKQCVFSILILVSFSFCGCSDLLSERGEVLTAICDKAEGADSLSENLILRYKHLGSYPNGYVFENVSSIVGMDDSRYFASAKTMIGGWENPQVYFSYSEEADNCAVLLDLESGIAGRACGENPIFDPKDLKPTAYYVCTLTASDDTQLMPVRTR